MPLFAGGDKKNQGCVARQTMNRSMASISLFETDRSKSINVVAEHRRFMDLGKFQCKHGV